MMHPRFIAVPCGAALLALAPPAAASPIGTPVANAPRGGKGIVVDLGHGRGGKARAPDATPAPAGAAEAMPNGIAAAAAMPVRRHRTAAEWRRDYIAKHHHDLPSLRHPN